MYSQEWVPICELLRDAGLQPVAEVIFGLSETVDQATDPLEKLYGNTTRSSLDGMLDSLREHRSLSEDAIARLQQYWCDYHVAIQDLASVRAGGTETDELTCHLRALDAFGVLCFEPTRRLVYPFIHPAFVTVMFRYFTSFRPRDAAKHIEQVLQVRQAPALDHLGIYERWVKPCQMQIQARLRAAVDEYKVSRVPSTDLQIELLPTSTDFYQAGHANYRSRTIRRRTFTAFARTPGGLLPEEYYGSAYFDRWLKRPDLASDTPKNPMRSCYFRSLLDAKKSKPRVYYFDANQTRMKYEETMARLNSEERDLYRLHARRLIKKCTCQEHFGLYRVPELPPLFRYLSVGSSMSVLISQRAGGRVAHGYWLKPLRWPLLAEVLSSLGIEDITTRMLEALTTRSERKTASLFLDLTFVFWTNFVPALAGSLVARRSRATRHVRGLFFDLADDIHSQGINVEPIEEIDCTHAVKPIREIEDLFE